MAPASRTFILTSPHMHGDDVGRFQQLLNERYDHWSIEKRIAVDDDYGDITREAAREVCKGLGIQAQAMRHGVTPKLRTKIRHPERRTAQEIARSKGEAAEAFRAKLRKALAQTSSVGVVVIDGVEVAAWMAPSLLWARKNGWKGKINSGYRSCRHQQSVAAVYAAQKGLTVAQVYPNGVCASNHVGNKHPRGAVDVTEPAQLAQVLRNNPNRPNLVWGGPVMDDPVHFSANGH